MGTRQGIAMIAWAIASGLAVAWLARAEARGPVSGWFSYAGCWRVWGPKVQRPILLTYLVLGINRFVALPKAARPSRLMRVVARVGMSAAVLALAWRDEPFRAALAGEFSLGVPVLVIWGFFIPAVVLMYSCLAAQLSMIVYLGTAKLLSGFAKPENAGTGGRQ